MKRNPMVYGFVTLAFLAFCMSVAFADSPWSTSGSAYIDSSTAFFPVDEGVDSGVSETFTDHGGNDVYVSFDVVGGSWDGYGDDLEVAVYFQEDESVLIYERHLDITGTGTYDTADGIFTVYTPNDPVHIWLIAHSKDGEAHEVDIDNVVIYDTYDVDTGWILDGGFDE